MAPTILYFASILGALALYLLLRRGRTARGRMLRPIGALLGVGVFGWLVVEGANLAAGPDGAGRPEAFYLLFSLIAVTAAVRMITHARPVYAALHFVIVVLSSAGLFLLLEAEFMAFALIIVYAGAILITYMFVLMLAQQAPNQDDPDGQPEYDRNPREPAAGAVVAFVLLALLTQMIFRGAGDLPSPPAEAEALRGAWNELREMPGRIERVVAAEVPEPFTLDSEDGLPVLEISADGRSAVALYTLASGERSGLELPLSALPENVQHVGYGLIVTYPVSLELAGVILLLAMFGAVILARRQIELTDDETREAAGMRRVGHHDDPERTTSPAGGGA